MSLDWSGPGAGAPGTDSLGWKGIRMGWFGRIARQVKHWVPQWLRPFFLAPQEISGDLNARNLHLTVIQGLFNSAALSMVGPFAAIFAMKIGATKLHVAFLTSAPAIVSLLAMIPGALLIDRSDDKKRVTLLFMLAHRFFYLFLACIPFFPGPARPTAFVVLLALMNLPGAISNVAWQAFISRIVPSEKRAEVFTARSRLMSVVGTGVTLAMGLFLDRAVFPLGYQLAFIGAFLVALIELAVFRRTIDTRKESEGPPVSKPPASPAIGGPYPSFGSSSRLPVFSFWSRYGKAAARGIRGIVHQRRFVRYTLASMLFHLAWQIPWPLFSWYQVRVLHANNVWVSMLALMNTGGALVGYGIWRRVIERWGNLNALVAATLPIFITPIVYAFSTSLYAIAASNLVVGAIFSGVNIALFNTLLEVTPDERKATFIAYFNTAITVSAVIAPLLGVGLLKIMSFRAAFLVAAAVRMAGSLVYLWLARRERCG